MVNHTNILRDCRARYFFLLILLPCCITSSAQEKDFSVNLESQLHYGFIVPHRSGMESLIKGHVKAMEVHWDIPTFGHKEWEQLYNYPSWGFSWYYADLANPEQLGFVTGVFPYINFSILRKKRFSINYHVGWGFSYFSKPFNQEENYKNFAIGSKLNSIIGIGLEAKWKISDRISATFGTSFTHFSNGAFTIPNLGINVSSLQTGLSYYLGKTGKEIKRDSISPLLKKYEIAYIVAGGARAVYPLGNPKKFPAFTMNATFGMVRSPKNQFLVGLDLFYNSALLNHYKQKNIELSTKLEILQTGISLNYMAKISRVNIIMGMGTYIYTKYKLDGPFYHRIGMRYKLNEHLFANITLNSHFFKANYSEWGIGYRL